MENNYRFIFFHGFERVRAFPCAFGFVCIRRCIHFLSKIKFYLEKVNIILLCLLIKTESYQRQQNDVNMPRSMALDQTLQLSLSI